jgi:hypothetical protein
LDFGLARVVEEATEFEAHVGEMAAGNRMVQEFVNDGLEVGQ